MGATDSKTHFIFICRITRFSHFVSHHILPQAASVCCKYAVKTLDFSEALVPYEVYYWRIFTEFGSRKWSWGDGFNFIAHIRNLAWDASIKYHFGADGVFQLFSVCQPQSFHCQCVNIRLRIIVNCWILSVMTFVFIFLYFQHCMEKLFYSCCHFIFSEEVSCTFVCVFVCMYLMNCMRLRIDWRLPPSVYAAAGQPAFFLPPSCWLLLRSRDKAHWCLSAPWQITEQTGTRTLAYGYSILESKEELTWEA